MPHNATKDPRHPAFPQPRHRNALLPLPSLLAHTPAHCGAGAVCSDRQLHLHRRADPHAQWASGECVPRPLVRAMEGSALSCDVKVFVACVLYVVSAVEVLCGMFVIYVFYVMYCPVRCVSSCQSKTGMRRVLPHPPALGTSALSETISCT